jgi:sugar/nucleoside kinase (ribokinase family)
MKMSILCVGQLVADIVVRPVNRLPHPGRTEPVKEMELLSGGCAANTAAVLAKLGAETRLAALIGRDALGDAALADVAAAGVIVDAVRREAGSPTSAAIVLVDGAGQRSFYYRAGGCELLTNAHVDDGFLESASIVHIGGAMKLLRLDMGELMRRAKSYGCVTSLDTDWDIYGHWMERIEGALPVLDYLLTNEEEAAMLSGKERPAEAGRVLLAGGPKAVIIKRGERGAMLVTREGVSEFPAYPVSPVDTTCAGDAFVAGFLVGLGVDSAGSLADAVRLGNAAGALCTTRISHRAVTSLEAVRRLMEEGGK